MPKLTFRVVDYDWEKVEIYTDENPVPRMQFFDEGYAKIKLMAIGCCPTTRRVGSDGQFEETIDGTIAHIQEMKQELIRRFKAWLSSRGKVVELNQTHGESIEVDWPKKEKS